MIGASYSDADIARASLAQMNEISRRAEVAGLTFGSVNQQQQQQQQQPQPQQQQQGQASPSTSQTQSPQQPPQQQQQSQQQQPRDSQPQAGRDQQRPESSASRIYAAAAAAGLMPERPLSRQDALARIEELQRARPLSAQGQRPSQDSGAGSSSAGGSSGSTPAPAYDFMNMLGPQGTGIDERYGVPMNSSTLSHEGLQVFTVGHLMPKSSMDDENGNWSFDANTLKDAVVMPTPQGMGGDPPQEGENERQQPLVLVDEATSQPISAPAASMAVPGAKKLRVRRSTYVPGWAVPPRVLLVDDDAVSRKLSSKFLQVFGCAIDVAVDGIGAVNKMNLEKYDLVLMVSSFYSAVAWNMCAESRCVGYCYAEVGRCLCDVAHSTVRPYDAYHLDDE